MFAGTEITIGKFSHTVKSKGSNIFGFSNVEYNLYLTVGPCFPSI